ncbi:hypothetical protein [Oceanisphaera ostreae]|uniref:Uncharacterized protein n=1 Tax=Oceanisphaera ostreae TaxID=914151 RepID=A0ABW3KCD5_9GAMM
MKKVYPVRYKRSDIENDGTYFIVANDTSEAEEIAFSCIANNPPPRSEGPDRPASYGREIAKVWVKDSWAQPTESDKVGLIGSGSEILIAKALALYVKENNQLY